MNSDLHQREKQSPVRSPLAPRTFLKLSKASRAGSYSGPRLLSQLAGASTSSGTVISSSEVPESSALTNSPSPPAYHLSCGRRGNGKSTKGTAELVGSEFRNVCFVARGEDFGAEMPSSSMSAPSSTAGSPVSSQDTPWMQNLRAFIYLSTGNVKLPPRAVQTPHPGQTVAVIVSICLSVTFHSFHAKQYYKDHYSR